MSETSGVPTWAFMALLGLFNLFLGFLLTRLWQSVDKNTEAVAGLRESLPTVYATKAEINRHHDEDRQAFEDQRKGLHGIRDQVHAIDLRVTSLDGGVRDAQAGLRG